MKYVYILGCDVDAQTHGCFSTPEKAIEKAESMLGKPVSDRFKILVDCDDLYIGIHEVDSDENEENVDLEDFKERYTQ